MKIFQADVVICATMYVKADSAQEAFDKAKPHHFTDLEFPNRAVSDWLEVSGAELGSDDLPEISLSPMMTFFMNHPDGKQVGPEDFTETV